MNYTVQLPVTERVADDIVSLPIYPGMPMGDIEKVVQTMKEFYGRN